MGFIQRQLLNGVLKVVAHPRLTLAISAVLLAGSIALALSRLTISTDQNKLFSLKVKFFRDYLDYVAKFPENEAIYVVIETADSRQPPVQRWVDLAESIAQRLRQMPQHVRTVETRIPVDQLGSQGILFEDPARLQQTLQDARAFQPLLKLWGEKPDLLTAFLGSSPLERFVTGVATQKPDEQTSQVLTLLGDGLARTLQNPDEPLRVGAHIPDLTALDAADPLRLGYYYCVDESDRTRHLMLVRVYQRQDYSSLTSICRTVEAIRSACHEAARGFPEFVVGVTGRPALDADEMRTTDRDTRRAEIIAVSVVFVGLIIMFRSLWLALAAEIALAVAIGWTFGLATIAVGELNLLSMVFLIALIGIGMDYLIQILMAYQRESRRYVRAEAIWARVFRYVGPPVLTACLGASGAFLVALFTDFRGAAELGIIAGGGLLLCLAASYTVLPAILVLFGPRVATLHPSVRYGGTTPPRRLGWRRMLLPAIWLAALLAGVPFALKAYFNPNLLELQAPNLESVRLIGKLQGWSAVVLSRDLKVLEKARQSLAGAPTVKSTDSILIADDNYAYLQQHKNELPRIAWAPPAVIKPDDLQRLQTKARNLADLLDKQTASASPTLKVQAQGASAALQRWAALLAPDTPATQERTAARLSAWQERFVAYLKETLAQLNPQPLDIQKVPQELRGRYVSADGVYALYVYPRGDLWQQQGLARFVQDIESRVGSLPEKPIVTGIAPNIHHSTQAVEHSFYKATIYALCLIFVLVLGDLRRLGQTLVAISVVVLGLPMLVALMVLMNCSWNFANFFALPILIGAGHEYGVFMVHRYREALHNPRRIWRIWDVSDRALLLCAFVTSSSFAFFWATGHHEGLKSLGLVMALGSACIYLATLMVVRPLLMWQLERKPISAHASDDLLAVPTAESR